METYISLLRGINVSGQKKILMKDLKELYESLGFKNVQTYIQSGNVLFQYKKEPASKLSAKIEKAIEAHYGFQVHVQNLTISEWNAVIAANPFITKQPVVEKLYVAFLNTSPEAARLDTLNAMDMSPDKFVVKDKAIYTAYGDSYGTSKMHNNFFESKLRIMATTRNWKTTLKLKELAEAMSATK